MTDYAERYAEKQADLLTKKIRKTYKQAEKEIEKKLKEFKKQHEIIDAKMRRDLSNGIITKQDYQNWLRSQVFQGELWEQKLKDITNVYVNADEKARQIIGETEKRVFAESSNFTAYSIAKDFGNSVAFNIYDAKTIERLIKDNPKMLPEWKINEKKDYIWNEKRVQNAVTQGIIQGESVYDIGNRLTNELSAQNANKMDMFARTAITGAQNGGRVERMKETEEKGIEVKKKWICLHDNRVRDAHAELDNVEVGVNEHFHNIIGDIDYPGDPYADPANVYNCRCTLLYVYPKYEPKKETHHFETYAEWKERNKN